MQNRDKLTIVQIIIGALLLTDMYYKILPMIDYNRDIAGIAIFLIAIVVIVLACITTIFFDI